MEVKCTQCGAKTPVAERQGLAKCQYCNAALYVDLVEGVPHLVSSPVIKPQQLKALLKSWLAGKERKGSIEVRENPVVYWPFWEIRGADGEPIYFIAASHPITDMEDAGRVSVSLKLYEAEEELEGVYFQPPDDTLGDFLERRRITGASVRLIHLPFFQVGYDYDGVRHEAWVEAVSGKVYADELPPTFARKKDLLYRNAVIMAALFYALVGVAIPDGNIAILVMAAISFPLFYIVKSYLSKEYS